MKSNHDVARGWLRKADSDLRNAELCLAADESLDTACFHCQQAAEKALKAFLIDRGLTCPLVHDLKRVLDCCLPADPTFKTLEPLALQLNPFAVQTRYDDEFWPDLAEVQDAVAAAKSIRQFIQVRMSGITP
jgi:HEPN domain-containing protein